MNIHPFIDGDGWIGRILVNLFLGAKWFEQKQVSESIAVKIVDGDTFDTDTNVRVRSWGIDAPENPKGCLSKRSKSRLEELILGKKLKLEERGEDNFGRTLAKVWQDDLYINKVLVTEGLASVSKDDDELDLVENEAKAAK